MSLESIVILLADMSLLTEHQVSEYVTWLSRSELHRYAKFSRLLRRQQFLLGRILLRYALGRSLNHHPRQICLQERAGKGPALVSPRSHRTGFSISHTRHWVACAVSLNSPVGLDIEYLDPNRDFVSLGEQAFGFEAAAELKALGQENCMQLFYTMWCKYEADIKLGSSSSHHQSLIWNDLAVGISSTADFAPIQKCELISLTELSNVK